MQSSKRNDSLAGDLLRLSSDSNSGPTGAVQASEPVDKNGLYIPEILITKSRLPARLILRISLSPFLRPLPRLEATWLRTVARSQRLPKLQLPI